HRGLPRRRMARSQPVRRRVPHRGARSAAVRKHRRRHVHGARNAIAGRARRAARAGGAARVKPYADVIGDPIAQSKSPAIHGYWLERLGIDAEYRPAHISAAALAGYLAERRSDPAWRGCNVTMPHKQAVMPHLDRLDPLAGRIGAVNTIARGSAGALTGYNTDAAGFLEPLRGMLAREHLFRMARVCGTGGAARAI